MPESITSTTEILDKEALDFKVEIGLNKDGDRIIKILSKDTSVGEYEQIVEAIATERGGLLYPVETRTELEQFKNGLDITTIPFTKDEMEAMRKMIERIENVAEHL